MYFFNYFMDLNKSPEDVMKDRWYTTNLENIDNVLGMSPINTYSALETTKKNISKFGRRKVAAENNVYTNISTTDAHKIQREIRKEIEMLAKGVKMPKYFNEYNCFTGINDSYLYNMNTISKAVRKNKSTNLFTIDKSKLPASFRQTFETASGEAVNNLALIENAINNVNSTQVVNDIINVPSGEGEFFTPSVYIESLAISGDEEE